MNAYLLLEFTIEDTEVHGEKYAPAGGQTAKGRATLGRAIHTEDLMVERCVSAVSPREEGHLTSTSQDGLLAGIASGVQERVMGFICDVLFATESIDGTRGWADAIGAFCRRRRERI